MSSAHTILLTASALQSAGRRHYRRTGRWWNESAAERNARNGIARNARRAKKARRWAVQAARRVQRGRR